MRGSLGRVRTVLIVYPAGAVSEAGGDSAQAALLGKV
jgi:hypothetical protein